MGGRYRSGGRGRLLGGRPGSGLVLLLLAMMLDDATGGSAHDGVMTGDMTRHAAHRRALDAALGCAEAGQQNDGCRDQHGNEQFAQGNYLDECVMKE
jgi:hypothetical protein